jgi:hypothetical protein
LFRRKGENAVSDKSYDIQPDERSTPVVVCTPRFMVWGDLVTKQAVRVENYLNILAEDFVPVWDAKALYLAGGQDTEPLQRLVIHIKREEILAFFSPHEQEPPPQETELRRYEPVSLLVGDFQIDAEMLKSPMTEISALLTVAKDPFLSFYRATVRCLSHPWLGAFQPPMVQVQRGRMLMAMTELVPTRPLDL